MGVAALWSQLLVTYPPGRSTYTPKVLRCIAMEYGMPRCVRALKMRGLAGEGV
jgi:hypothetical protein